MPNGPEGAWDQFSIHDPYPLVYKGRIYLYYKSEANGKPEPIRFQGVAMADDPLGLFEKYSLNPVPNSGYETGLFPFKGGIAALAIRHGNKHNTIQFAPDEINFEVASSVSLMPIAPGPYMPDAFTDTGGGHGITWGYTPQLAPKIRNTSILARFDCDLSQDHHNPWMKETEYWWPPEFYFFSSLGEGTRRKRERMAREDLTREQ